MFVPINVDRSKLVTNMLNTGFFTIEMLCSFVISHPKRTGYLEQFVVLLGLDPILFAYKMVEM